MTTWERNHGNDAGVRRAGPATGDHQRRQRPIHPGARRDPVRRGHADRARDRGRRSRSAAGAGSSARCGRSASPAASCTAASACRPSPRWPRRWPSASPSASSWVVSPGSALRRPPGCAHRSFDLAARAPRRVLGQRSSSRGWSRCRARPWPPAASSRSGGSDGPAGIPAGSGQRGRGEGSAFASSMASATSASRSAVTPSVTTATVAPASAARTSSVGAVHRHGHERGLPGLEQVAHPAQLALRDVVPDVADERGDRRPTRSRSPPAARGRRCRRGRRGRPAPPRAAGRPGRVVSRRAAVAVDRQPSVRALLDDGRGHPAEGAARRLPAERPEAFRGGGAGRVGRGSHDDGLLAHEAPSTRLADGSTLRLPQAVGHPPLRVNRRRRTSRPNVRARPDRCRCRSPPSGWGTVRHVSTRAPGRARPAAAGAHRGRRVLTFELDESKLAPPPIRSGIVDRAAIVERLLGPGQGSVIAVVAPPGYGKTTRAGAVGGGERAPGGLAVRRRPRQRSRPSCSRTWPSRSTASSRSGPRPSDPSPCRARASPTSPGWGRSSPRWTRPSPSSSTMPMPSSAGSARTWWPSSPCGCRPAPAWPSAPARSCRCRCRACAPTAASSRSGRPIWP